MREWLRSRRKDSGLKMEEMAEKLGISTAYYYYIENRERQKTLDLSLAAKISDIFGMDVKQIVKLEAEENERSET